MSERKTKSKRIDRDPFRTNLMKYTRLAFSLIPEDKTARILDMGCGSGVQTIGLAKLTKGYITAIDINQEELDRLKEKVLEEGFEHRVKPYNMSIDALDFEDERFDLIWAEGSIFVLGFRKSIVTWKELLTEKGCIVLHDQKQDFEKKLESIAECGFELLGLIVLNNHTWWKDYYEPLEHHITELSKDPIRMGTYSEDIDLIRKEIAAFKREGSESVFFIIQKK